MRTVSAALSTFLLFFLCSVPAFANVRLTFDVTTLDFGSLPLTGSKDLAVNVTNTSSSDVEIDNITSSLFDFTVVAPTNLPVVVPANTTIPISIIVRFAPKVLGVRTGTLEVTTSDGAVDIMLTGVGSGTQGQVHIFPSSIDFGTVGPRAYVDTIVTIYSDGPDSSTITGYQISNSSDTAFSAWFQDEAVFTPFKLGPRDSVKIVVQFNGLLPEEQKNGTLTIFGDAASLPSCALSGQVTMGKFELQPAAIDFGLLYEGETKDSTVSIVNTGESTIRIDDIQPIADDFSFVNLPTVPIRVPIGGKIDLTVRAAPKVSNSHFAQVQAISFSSQPTLSQANLSVRVQRAPISGPSTQSFSYLCNSGTPTLIVPITDTGSRAYAITSVSSDNADLNLTTLPPLPVQIVSGATSTIQVRFDPTKVTGGKFILRFYGGDQLVLTDTVTVQSTSATIALAAHILPDVDTTRKNVSVVANGDLSALDLHTVVVDLHSSDDDVLTIVPSTVMLDPSVTNATLQLSPLTDGGFSATITSNNGTNPIGFGTGGKVLSFVLSRFVGARDSARILVAATAPEKAECISFYADSAILPGLGACGKGYLQSLLSGSTLSITLLENPVTGANAVVAVRSEREDRLSYEVITELGERVGGGSVDVHGTGDGGKAERIEIPISSAPHSAVLYLRLVASNGAVQTLRLIRQ